MRNAILLPASVGIALLLACAVALLAALATAPVASAANDLESGPGFFQKCSLATTGSFDPIVYPGKQNTEPIGGHRHLFFGSTAISYDTDSASDLQVKAGGSTCHFKQDSPATKVFPDGAIGGNYSSYWVPDLKLRDGTWASAVQLNAYYNKGAASIDKNSVKAFPSGLKMVIHDLNNNQTKVIWYCSALGGEGNNGVHTERPYDCDPYKPDYPYVSARIIFPQCGTGATDSPDHISHMAFPGDSGCPKKYPKVFPRLSIAVKYDTSIGANSQLAPAMGDAHSDPATGFHADYFEGWKPGTLEYFVDACIHNGINCQSGTKLP
jgi:hypothetical protein